MVDHAQSASERHQISKRLLAGKRGGYLGRPAASYLLASKLRHASIQSISEDCPCTEERPEAGFKKPGLPVPRYVEVRAELLKAPGGRAALLDGVPDLLIDGDVISQILQVGFASRALTHSCHDGTVVFADFVNFHVACGLWHAHFGAVC